MADFFADGQDSSQVTYKPSNHLFTEPIRYFKANDPYYWEVDNIPLKQVQQNILWLRDQVGWQVGSDEGAVKRSDFAELRPRAGGDTHLVTVDPGRFMGRVNDAYGTGIGKLVTQARADYSIIPPDFDSDKEVTFDTMLFRRIIGEAVTGIVGNNGLYDFLQTHTSTPITANVNTVGWQNTYGSFQQNDNSENGIIDIPKIKLALWKADTTAKNFGPDAEDLQQLAVDFTRAWGAPFRTALVNVEKQLSIEVPPFNDEDYVNNDPAFVPSTRVDLLFVYTKPIDASSTAIARANGTSAVELTSPQLGIVKGAGVISLNAVGPDWTDVTVDPAFLGGDAFDTQKNNPDNRFQALGALDANNNNQISSPTVDLRQTSIGTSGVYGNFPSPDDLMNLAPYLADELQSGSKHPALIGQSILPLAYIFVRKGQLSITNNDILDIRPFFRTAELTYNERAGIAAANPPASLANPVVTNSDLANRLSHIGDLIPKISVSSISVERTEYFDETNGKGGVQDVFKGGKVLTQLNAKTWEISGIAAADKDKVTSVIFRVWFSSKSGDIDETNQIFFTGGNFGPIQVARARFNISKGDVSQYQGDSAVFNFPVTTTIDSEDGTTNHSIYTTMSGGKGQNEMYWYCYAWGYTAKDTVIPVSVTY